MKKALLIIPLLAGLSGYAFADNDDCPGNSCHGTPGPQGPAGPQGPQGAAGKNGANGANGTNGNNAASGWAGTNLAADVAVRLADSKYLQLQAYNTYVFGSHPGQDVFGQGFNQTIGARIVIKLGSSYEENLIEKQSREIKALEAALSRLQ